MTLPRILIVDDLYGRSARDRADFCVRTGIQDVTGAMETEQFDAPVAAGVFISGQVLRGSEYENDVETTIAAIRAGFEKSPRWALILLDIDFADRHAGRGKHRKYFGLTLLEFIHADAALRDAPVVMLSSTDRAETERHFSEHGALDFADKSVLNRRGVAALLTKHGLVPSPIVCGTSLPLLICLRHARRRARRTDENVLLIGETGTGKELIARYAHENSGRTGRYVTLFPQGVPETLLEDNLFGHEKNAFTGANQPRPGAAELADRGTLFIDEFGSIPAAVQPKLLRLLDRNLREVQRLGSNVPRNLDLLVVMATQDIESLGEHKRDLLQRARAGDAVRVPPLRERREDIPLLFEVFMRRYIEIYDAEPRQISPEVIERLVAHDWPGNVRELENVAEAIVSDFPGLRYVTPAHLKIQLQSTRAFPRPHSGQPAEPTARTAELDDVLETMQHVTFPPDDVAGWSGKLPTLMSTFGGLIARYVSAHLAATRRRSPRNLDGEVLIHPAVKLMTDDPAIAASKAADVIKRLLTISGQEAPELDSDPLLREAYQTCLRLRPRSVKRKPPE